MYLRFVFIALCSISSLLVSGAKLSHLEKNMPSCAVGCYTTYLEKHFGSPDAWATACTRANGPKFFTSFYNCSTEKCSEDDKTSASAQINTICQLEIADEVTGSGLGSRPKVSAGVRQCSDVNGLAAAAVTIATIAFALAS